MTDPTPAAHLSAGHQIIATFERRAQELASSYPAVKFLLPAIVACLHDLLTHLASSPAASPLEKTLETSADSLVGAAAADLLQPPLPGTEPPPASAGEPAPAA